MDFASARGWLCLLGGGEFSFGETEAVDRAWLAKVGEGPIGFVPAAAGSADYGRHFAAYLERIHGREVETIPIYRDRDARRGKNAERIAACPAVYLGGGVPDHLLEALAGSPALAELERKVAGGGVVVAIAAAAQACGTAVRSVFAGRPVAGFGWLAEAVVEANFDPAHDRRLRKMLSDASGARTGWGIPNGGGLFFGAGGSEETIGPVFRLAGADADLAVIETQG